MTTYRLMDGLSGRPGVGSSGTQPPSSPTSYSGQFLAGIKFGVTQGGMWFQGYWWWVPPGGDINAGTGQKFALWSMTSSSPAGTLVANSVVTSGTLTAGQWNYVPLPAPVQISVSGTYVAATGWSAAAGFPDTNNQFASGQPYVNGITNGPLTAFSDGTAGGTHNSPYGGDQGLFSASLGTDPSVHMPNAGSNSANFWVDVQVSDTAPAGYSGSYRLWPNSANANAATVADASVNYDVATEFALSQPCALNRVWYYSPAAATQLATAASVWGLTAGGLTGTLIAANTSPSWSGAAGSGWISVSFSGVTLAPGKYKVGVYNNSGSPAACFAKDANTDYWRNGAGASGIVNGPLSAPNLASASLAYNFNGNPAGTPPNSDGTTLAAQSTFYQATTVGGPDSYPDLVALVTTPTAGSTQNYWADPEVTPVPAGSGLLMACFP